jgi:TetR/AcrR family transcriptional repressor of nem operon
MSMGRVSDAKNRLIETALQLIWEESYRAVGVSEICKKAGVKPGSFYYFFPSKEALALAALEHHWQEARQTLLNHSFADEIPPLERITRLFQAVYAFHAARQKKKQRVLGCAFGSFVGELGEEDEALRTKLAAILAGIRAYFEKALKQAAAAGKLGIKPKEVPARAQALVAFYEGVLLLARAQNDAEIIRQLTPHALKLAGA